MDDRRAALTLTTVMLVSQGLANGGGALVLRVTNVYGDEPRGKNFVSRVAANGAKSAADGGSRRLHGYRTR